MALAARHTKPTNSFSRRLPVGVNKRTGNSLSWGRKAALVIKTARALARGVKMEEREQQTQHTRCAPADNQNFQPSCVRVTQPDARPSSLGVPAIANSQISFSAA